MNKEVIQTNSIGETIRIYESAKEVEEVLGVKEGAVRNMCNGLTEFNKHGYHFRYTTKHKYYEKRRAEVLELFKQGATKDQVHEMIEISTAQLDKMHKNYIQFLMRETDNSVICNSQLRTYLPIADIKKHFRGEKDKEPLYIYEELSKSEKLIYKEI